MARLCLSITIIFASLSALGVGQNLEKSQGGEPAIIGEWRCVGAEVDGEKSTKEDTRMMNLVVRFLDGGKLHWEDAISGAVGKYKANGRSGNGQIDIKFDDYATILLGIYRFEKGVMTLCYAPDTLGKRPDVFSTKQGDKRTLLYFIKN